MSSVFCVCCSEPVFQLGDVGAGARNECHCNEECDVRGDLGDILLVERDY